MTKRKRAKEVAEIKLNLGCGRTKLEGYVNVDMRRMSTVDVIHDLRKTPWPWENNSISEINCIYVFNYLTSCERINFMNECGRILKNGGKLFIQVPHRTSVRAVSDPMYQWPPVAETTFCVYNKEWRIHNEQDHYPIKCDFDHTYGYGIDNSLNMRSDEYKQMALRHYNNVVMDLLVTLIKRDPVLSDMNKG